MVPDSPLTNWTRKDCVAWEGWKAGISMRLNIGCHALRSEPDAHFFSFPDHVETLFSIPALWGLSPLRFISGAHASLLNNLHAPWWALPHNC